MGAAAEATALDHPTGDGQHVLDRPAGLGADQVVGPVGPEGRGRQRLGQGLAAVWLGAGQGDGGRQATRHLAGEAGAGEDDRPRMGRCLGQHLGHQLQRALFHPLGAEHHRLVGAQMRAKRGQGGAHVLGWDHGQDQVAAGGLSQVAGRADGRIQRDIGQEEPVGVALVHRLHHLGLPRPEQGVQTGPGADLGQGGAPGSAADDPGAFEAAQALAPLRPGTWVGRFKAASSSSGQRGRATASSPSTSPSASRSAPAKAIMAALSVQ